MHFKTKNTVSACGYTLLQTNRARRVKKKDVVPCAVRCVSSVATNQLPKKAKKEKTLPNMTNMVSIVVARVERRKGKRWLYEDQWVGGKIVNDVKANPIYYLAMLSSITGAYLTADAYSISTLQCWALW